MMKAFSFVIGCALLAGCACAPRPSSFEFGVRGDLNETVTGSGNAFGEIDDEGNIVVVDARWMIRIKVASSAARVTRVGDGAFELVIVERTTGDTFTTASGGTCEVMVAPHHSGIGSAVKATFSCERLVSADGKKTIDVSGGALRALIDDDATA